MAEETEISTPVETTPDTSVDAEPIENIDTSATEPENLAEAAETETGVNEGNIPPTQEGGEGILYAGKYKSVEDLEKGYSEAQKMITKAAEFEKKYNDLLKSQQEAEEKAQLQRLKEAQQRGFDSVEAQQIADKVQLAEFEYLTANLNQVINPQDYETVRACLQEYYATGHKAYLDEAKKYFPSQFIENVALEKSKYQAQLQQDLDTQRQQLEISQAKKLAEVIQSEYAEFLGDLEQNEGKALALKSFCNVGSINSKEDMQVFLDIYSKIAAFEREQAIKELEAQKAIEETKQKAMIDTGAHTASTLSGLKESYTAQEIGAMSQAEYDALCDQFGELEITKRIKG